VPGSPTVLQQPNKQDPALLLVAYDLADDTADILAIRGPGGEKLGGLRDLGVLAASPASPLIGGGVVWSWDPRVGTAASAVTASAAFGNRVKIPRTGTITEMAVFVGGSSGNYDLGVYRPTVGTPTSRDRVQSSGSQAVAGTNAWLVKTGYSIPVVAGEIVDLVFACDNGTATFARPSTSLNACAALPAGWDSDAAGSEVLNWTKAASFPLPAQLTGINAAAVTNTIVAILARIT
jgi:hypothetical protein